MKGKFKCTKCERIFRCAPLPNGAGWYIICPSGCYTEIKYDNCRTYYVDHHYFEWLNYDEFKIGDIRCLVI